jgi:hypothetical protein
VISNGGLGETGQILIYVCLPILLILIAFIVFLFRGNRSTKTFPTFSITISKVGRNEAYLTYLTNYAKTELDAEIGRGRSFFVPRIAVRVPEDMVDCEVRRIVSDIALGLKELHYEFVVYRRRKPDIIPDEERNEAIAELHQMGFDIDRSPEQELVVRAVSHGWRRTSGREAKAIFSRTQALIMKARGFRENLEILARN